MKFDIDACWEKIQSGDLKAYETFYRQLHPGLCYYAGQLTGDAFAAEEIVQDAFLNLWLNRETLFSKNHSIRAFLYRSTHNRCINYCTQRKTRKRNFLTYATSAWWYEIGEQFAYDESLIEELYARETLHTIERLAGELPEQCREVFRLSRFEGKTNNEIATLLGISPLTVKTQLYRALSKLKKALFPG
jgi:RNA polymerase sigma-70 factor (ECF subfamily)